MVQIVCDAELKAYGGLATFLFDIRLLYIQAQLNICNAIDLHKLLI